VPIFNRCFLASKKDLNMTIIVNKQPIKYFNFSGGECCVSISNIIIDETTEVIAYLHNSDDIMCLIMSVDAIRQKNALTNINLKIPYFPYARQDRVCNEGEAFSLSVMANLINNLKCENVTVYDPHSKVTTDLLDNCTVVTQAEILISSVVVSKILEKQLILVSPDAGAENKTRQIADKLNIEAIYCTKIRNSKTGQITKTQIPGGVSGKSFIIVDDICDRGGTFTEIAKALKNEGCNELYLYVTHGIFSKGLELLKKYFKHIYCYHYFSKFANIDPEFLTIMESKQNED
jgi:ribose-phosphate pyrophosphokinase